MRQHGKLSYRRFPLQCQRKQKAAGCAKIERGSRYLHVIFSSNVNLLATNAKRLLVTPGQTLQILMLVAAT